MTSAARLSAAIGGVLLASDGLVALYGHPSCFGRIVAGPASEWYAACFFTLDAGAALLGAGALFKLDWWGLLGMGASVAAFLEVPHMLLR